MAAEDDVVAAPKEDCSEDGAEKTEFPIWMRFRGAETQEDEGDESSSIMPSEAAYSTVCMPGLRYSTASSAYKIYKIA